MRVVFCIYDFVTHNLPLQPWLTIYKVALGLVSRGHEVHVLTDVTDPAAADRFTMHSVRSLRGTNRAEVAARIRGLSPDVLVFLPTPLNLVSTGWLDDVATCRRVGFVSYPFYRPRELMRAFRCLRWPDIYPYIRHLMVPARSWRAACARRFSAMIVQSDTSQSLLSSHLSSRVSVHAILPGIELSDWPMRQSAPEVSKTSLVYLGAATPIRGFEILLQALRLAEGRSIRLRVLARGADEDAVHSVRAVIERYGVSDQVKVIGGWMERSILVSEFHSATAAVLPFILVPSELPISVMESIACGTPVISSRIDGLPSTIGPAGAIVPQANPAVLADMINKLHRDSSVRQDWAAGCIVQRKNMLDWSEVTLRWEAVLSDG